MWNNRLNRQIIGRILSIRNTVEESNTTCTNMVLFVILNIVIVVVVVVAQTVRLHRKTKIVFNIYATKYD